MILFLASQSPRRQAILLRAGIPFEQVPNRLLEESLDPSLPLADAVAQLSLRKAQSSLINRDGYVLGCDTVVVLDGQVLGKPSDFFESEQMLRRLNHRTHQVITGFGLIGVGACRGSYSGYDTAWVTIKGLSEAEIVAYSHREFVLDKAGGYAIQDDQFPIVSKCDGDMDTVIGLPIKKMLPILSECGII